MFAAVNRVSLYYEYLSHHHEKTVIMLHGNGEDHQIFMPLANKLKQDYNVLLVDLRSHGKSSYVSYLTYEDMVQDIYELINSLHLKRPSLIGFSDGGIVGLMLASKYPLLLKRLVTCSPNLSVKGFKMSEYLKLKKQYLVKADEKIRLMLEQTPITNEDLRKIVCPTLILAGQHDVIKQSHFKQIETNIKKSKLKIYPGCNHSDYIVNSDKCYFDIQSFLKRP